MDNYKLRVDLAHVGTDHILTKIIDDCEAYCYCVEHAADLHSHWYVRTNIKEATLRARLRSVGLKGNASYSLKELDGDYPIEYIAYLMKEGDFHSSNIPQEILDAAKAYDVKVKDEIKTKKEKRQNILKILHDYIISDPPRIDGVPHWYDNELVMMRILKYHRDEGLLLRRFQLQAYYDTLMYWNNEQFRHSYVQKFL